MSALSELLSACEPGFPVAVETIGNWHWIIDEFEAACMSILLVHARKAKTMGGADKNHYHRGLSMYWYEDRIQAVKLYIIKYGRSAADTHSGTRVSFQKDVEALA